MKTLRAIVIGLALVSTTFAAETANVVWMSDLEAAKAKAASEHKPLVLEFTGSTWCPPCKLLHARVLTSTEFAKFSEKVVLVALDYPTYGERAPEKVKANPELARLMAIKDKYGVTGFPTMFYFDAEGQQVSKIVGYGRESPTAYLARLTGAGD